MSWPRSWSQKGNFARTTLAFLFNVFGMGQFSRLFPLVHTLNRVGMLDTSVSIMLMLMTARQCVKNHFQHKLREEAWVLVGTKSESKGWVAEDIHMMNLDFRDLMVFSSDW